MISILLRKCALRYERGSNFKQFEQVEMLLHRMRCQFGRSHRTCYVYPFDVELFGRSVLSLYDIQLEHGISL